VDFSRIRDIGRHDVDFQRRIITLFIGETENWREAIIGAIQGGDFGALRGVAHSLKGGADNIGASRVAESAAQLQNVAEDDNAEACLEIRDRLFQEMDDAIDQLREYLLRLESGDID
jgi:HPt (histidine-containing phosphotransfer) domain-containing protein